MEKIVELRRDFDHMLHRLAEAAGDSAGESATEEFMRNFLQEMKDGVTAARSAQASMDIFDKLRSILARELIRLNIDAMEPGACALRPTALRSIPSFDIVDEGEFLGKGMFAVHSGWWRQGTSNGSLASASACIPVAVKTYKVPDEDAEHMDAVRLGRLFDRVELNAQRQLACVHNNVLRIFGSCRLDGSLKLVMPLITGGSLDAILRPLDASLPEGTQAVIGEMLAGVDNSRRSLALSDLFAGVSAALAHIHGFQPPVLHLDLKPANILVVLLPGGMLQPKLCDFDAARVIAEETSSSATTSSSKVAEGTYRYMSPERLKDSNSDSPAADVYAFAMVMTKCVIGKLFMPSNGSRPHLVGGMDLNWVYRIYNGERPELPIGTRDLETYRTSIENCWESDPTRRPSSKVLAEEHLKCLKGLRSVAIREQEAELRSSTNGTPPLAGSAGSASKSCPTHPSPSQQSFTESGAFDPGAVVCFDQAHDANRDQEAIVFQALDPEEEEEEAPLLNAVRDLR